MKLSEKVNRCNLSPIRKFYPLMQKARARGIQIIPLNIGQPDIETPRGFFEAITSYQQKVLDYAPSPGIPCMIEAIQTYYGKLDVHFDASEIIVTTGGSEALSMALSCILDEGDEVLVAEPFYPNYRTFVNMAGGRISPIPTTPEEGYHFASREKIVPRITEKTRALMLSNPGNPTGTILTQDEIRLVADIAKEYGLYLICDEVYREFIYEGELLTAAHIPGIEENLIIIDSVSKRFSACGARIGALISRNKEFMQAAMKLAQARLSVATVEQYGAAALYSVPDTYFEAVREEYRRRRDVCYAGLTAIPGIVVAEPKGAFYMMAKLPVDNAEKFQTFLLEEFEDNNQTVTFAPGNGFYATPGAGEQEIRVAYVLQSEDLQRALELLKLAIEKYQAKYM